MPYYRGRYFKARLSDEQMIEIGMARERLDLFRSKFQPYVYYKDDELEPVKPQEQVIIHRRSDMSKLEYKLLQDNDRAIKYLLLKQKEKEEKTKKYKTYEKP